MHRPLRIIGLIALTLVVIGCSLLIEPPINAEDTLEVIAIPLQQDTPFDISDDARWRSFYESIKGSIRTFGTDDFRPSEIDEYTTAGSFSVCGPDNRGVIKNITNQNWASEVASTKLLMEYKNVPDDAKYWQCSAAFVVPRKLVTAAHCMSLLPDYPDAQLVRIYVIPGAWKSDNGNNVEPFGRQVASWAVRDTDWNGRNWEHDWGFLLMPDTTLYDKMDGKLFAMKAMTDQELRRANFQASGYPADLDPDSAFKQAHTIGEKLTDVERYLVKSKVDTFGGMSGGPLYKLTGAITWSLVGIVSHGDAENRCRTDNGFTRLTQGRINTIKEWKPPVR